MLRGIFTIALTLCVGVASATNRDSLAREMAATITASDLKKHLTVLASDEYEGRETGEPGQKLAAEYISTFFKGLGLDPVVDGSYYQQVPLKKKMRKSGTISVGGTSFSQLEDFYTFGRAQNLEISTNEVVFLGYGIMSNRYNDYEGVDVKGKVVMMLDGEPRDKSGQSLVTGENGKSGWNVFAKAAFARENGANAVIVVKENFAFSLTRIKRYLERPQLSLDSEEDDEDNIPVYFVSGDLGAAVMKPSGKKLGKVWKKMEKKGKPNSFQIATPLKISMQAGEEVLEAENVLGFIEGTDLKDEILVVTAHYDHIGRSADEINNGADDDGSGTVTVLELAEAFKKAKDAGMGPRRSVLFMTVSGEEKGLLGSEYYVEHPVFPLENTIADLNIDMIGRIDEDHTDGNYVYLIGSDRLSSDLHKISENANETYTQLDLDYTYNDPDDINRFYYRSDHYNFAKNGIPVIFYFSGVHEDYHKPTDTVEKIDFEKMEKIAHLVFYTAWDLANRDERPVVDQSVEE